LRIGIPDLERFNPQRGIGRIATTLASHWAAWGHTVVSLSTSRVRLPVFRNMRLCWARSPRDVDILFLPDVWEAQLLSFSPSSLPSVVMVHDIGMIDCSEDVAANSVLTRALFRSALHAARRSMWVVADSEFTRSRLLCYAPGLAPKANVIHAGVDHAIFRPGDRLQARAAARAKGVPLSDGDNVAIYVGAEYPRKNLPALISAFARVRSRLPTARLLKVGASHDANARAATLDALQKERLVFGRDVLFVENAEDSFLAELYRAADVFVSASKYEGFGLPLLEAMACGIPAVVSNAGSFPEIGGDAALYVDPDDVDGFAARVEEVLGSDREAFARRAVGRAARFDWQKAARQVLDILQSAAAHGGA